MIAVGGKLKDYQNYGSSFQRGHERVYQVSQHSILWLRHFTQNEKCHPHGDARLSQESLWSVGYDSSCGNQQCLQHFEPIHSVDV